MTLAEEMEERDPHYSSVLRTRKLAVASLPVTVVAGGEDKRSQSLAEEVKQITQTPEFGDLVSNALDALGKGYSVNEIIWERGRRFVPKTYLWRDPRFFLFHQDHPDEIRLLDEKAPALGLPLPSYKFVVHCPKLKSGLVLRGGLARLVAFSYVCKMYGFKDWLSFIEIYGIPLRVGTYGNAARDEDKEILKQAISQIGSDAAAILPDSMQMEFHQVTQSATASDVFASMLEWIDKQVAKAVLGQVASSEGTPGKLGNENSQEAVRQDLIAADAKQLSHTLNRDLIKPFIDLNHGLQETYPQVVISIPEKEDISALADNLAKLVPLGLKVSASEVRAKLGLSEPSEEADLLSTSAKPEPEEKEADPEEKEETPEGEEPEEKGRNTFLPSLNKKQQQEVDDLAKEMLADWQPQTTPILDPIVQAVQEAKSYEALKAKLPQLLQDVQGEALIESLAKASLMAYGDGVEEND